MIWEWREVLESGQTIWSKVWIIFARVPNNALKCLIQPYEVLRRELIDLKKLVALCNTMQPSLKSKGSKGRPEQC